MGEQNSLKIAFFGTPEFAVSILDELKLKGIIPNLVVTNPDEPKGRKLLLTPPPVKIWADLEGIRVIQPESLKTPPVELNDEFDLFIVAAYGKLIPDEVLKKSKHGTLNVHPSLLPKYRGASPVQAALLNGDTETGVSIILLDAEMDHGPVVAEERFDLTKEQFYLPELKERLAKLAGDMLAKVIPDWVAGKVQAKEQDHSQATFTKKITNQDGFVPSQDLTDPNISAARAAEIERMVRALNPDPSVYTIFSKDKTEFRLKITRARLDNGKLVIEKVIPEGKKEMGWEDFLRGNPIK